MKVRSVRFPRINDQQKEFKKGKIITNKIKGLAIYIRQTLRIDSACKAQSSRITWSTTKKRERKEKIK